jgi:hypothetical protein
LLFEALLPVADTTHCSDWEPLAYVRWFKTEPARADVLSRYRVLDRDPALGLSWEAEVAGARGRINSYSIIPLSSIVQRVHVVPDFLSETGIVQPGSFHLNPFKY